jgi:hypothetical protein
VPRTRLRVLTQGEAADGDEDTKMIIVHAKVLLAFIPAAHPRVADNMLKNTVEKYITDR